MGFVKSLTVMALAVPLLAVGMAGLSEHAEATATCGGRRLAVSVQLAPALRVTNDTHSLAQLSAVVESEDDDYYKSIDAKFARQGLRTAGNPGYTKLSLNTTYTIDYEIQDAGGQTCLRAKGVQIAIAGVNEVFLAREYRPGSCARRAVQEHEMKHVAEHEAILRLIPLETAPKLERDLQDLQALSGPRSSLEAMKEQLRGRVEMAIDRAVQHIHADLDRSRKRIDTPQEYLNVSQQCRDW